MIKRRVVRFMWLILLGGIIMGVPQFVYNTANRVFGLQLAIAGEGELPRNWWLLLLAGIIANELLLLIIIALRRRYDANDPTKHKPFRYALAEYAPLALLSQFWFFLLTYPVASRLEKVGLGTLPMIALVVFVIVMVLFAIKDGSVPHREQEVGRKQQLEAGLGPSPEPSH